jgi:hypothetical protein
MRVMIHFSGRSARPDVEVEVDVDKDCAAAAAAAAVRAQENGSYVLSGVLSVRTPFHILGKRTVFPQNECADAFSSEHDREIVYRRIHRPMASRPYEFEYVA